MGTVLGDIDLSPGSWVSAVPLSPNAQTVLGEQTNVRLTITPWS